MIKPKKEKPNNNGVNKKTETKDNIMVVEVITKDDMELNQQNREKGQDEN